jgi:hypothetical protein
VSWDEQESGQEISMLSTMKARQDLRAAFPQLQRLTSLTLQRDLASTPVLSRISALQSLQRLTLDNTAADSFAALPQALTQLSLSFGPAGSLTASNAAAVSRLTALQSLYLRDVDCLDLSLLAGMRDLRSLQLFDCKLLHEGPRLQVVSRFTALTSLCIRLTGGHVLLNVTAAEAAALIASSQLIELTLSNRYRRLQLQDCASLFLPG